MARFALHGDLVKVPVMMSRVARQDLETTVKSQ